MVESQRLKEKKDSGVFSKELDSKVKRKLQARQRGKDNVWFGLGMMGLVGWSIVIPTLLGAGLGLWLDKHYSENHSWTLALLVAGLVLGCVNAWHWVGKEDKEIHEEEPSDDRDI